VALRIPRMARLSAKNTALMGVFISLHATLYLMSFGLWRNWAIYLEPIEGIILGPWMGFTTALIGSVFARTIKPTDVWMFGVVAEPMGVLACGLIAQRRWKPLVAVYAAMLAAYFVHPYGRWLPLWTILDILIALILIYPVTKTFRGLFDEGAKRLPIQLALISFIGSATDALARVFLLIPVGLYTLFGWSPEVVSVVFVAGAIDSYIEDALVVAISSLVGVPLIVAVRKIPGLRRPMS
jgi:hypothetical protein